MKPHSAKILLLIAIALVCLAACDALAQPPDRPRPLPAEFKKRRLAGSAFQLGRIYLGQRKPAAYRLALENFKTAVGLYRELGDEANAGCALVGIGFTESLFGNRSEAAQTYQQALTIFRSLKGEGPDKRALASLGFLYDELVDKPTGFKYGDLSIDPPKPGYDRNGDRIDTRFSQLDERYPVQYFNQPFTVRISADSWRDRPDPRFAGSDDPPEPVSFYKDVLAIWHLNGADSLEVATGVNLMEAWADDNPAVAIFYGKRAINHYQQVRKSIQENRPYRTARYVNQLADKYRFLADLLIGLGRLAEADDVLQMLKEEEFSEFVMRDAAEIKSLGARVRLTVGERRLIERYARLAERAGEIGEQLRGLEERKRTLADDGKSLAKEDDEKLRQLSAQAADINKAFRLFVDKELTDEIGADNARVIGYNQSLQGKLREWGDGTVAIYTVITEHRCRTVMTTPTIQIDGKTTINAVALNKKIYAFRQALQDPAIDPRPLGKELYDILLGPIEKNLMTSGAKTLLWSLDGALRYIPVAALSPDGRSYLAEKYETAIMTTRTRDRITAKNADWRGLGMGVSLAQTVTYPDNPKQTLSVPALPGTREELTAIIRDEREPGEKGIIEGKRFLDGDFTIANFTDSLAARTTAGAQKFTVVHLASHFRLGQNWSNSFLFLGNGKVLTLEQMSKSAELDFTNVEIVTLSACNTALLTAATGLEVDSLAEAIQAKGGKAVLATLWDVYDESTVTLMTDFYRFRNAAPRQTKSRALQLAQQKMIGTPGAGTAAVPKPKSGNPASVRFSPDPTRPFAHPYFWSGFVLMGNWR